MTAEQLPEPTIHDQAFWDEDLDRLSEGWQPFEGVKLNEMTPQENAEFVSFVWSSLLKYRGYIQELALESPKAKKPRAPKAPPELNGD
jgi:hypothetical protein